MNKNFDHYFAGLFMYTFLACVAVCMIGLTVLILHGIWMEIV